jgi:alkylated DNA repair dioxygenase AlkB
MNSTTNLMAPSRTIELADGGLVQVYEHWIASEDTKRIHAALRAEVPWAQRTIKMFGRDVLEPRETAWLGDPGAGYSYSGRDNVPVPWTPTLAMIRRRLERETGHVFNGVLANHYRDGSDSIGWHSDAERELGTNPVVASVSFGATRLFRMLHRRRSDLRLWLELTDGMLIVMAGATQHHWRHSVPKEKGSIGPRINLTFRRIVGGR